ncbi:MAG: Ig-like domain-containing protein, partial [Bifidobacteriaceae bacterium]|nr:Ig-like domain-containing protein [Bifidobacteriaceae bacterium]
MVDLDNSTNGQNIISPAHGTTPLSLTHVDNRLPECAAGGSNEDWSAEVNQKNGYLYVIGSAAGSPTIQSASGTTLSGIYPRIFRVNTTGTTSTSRFTCVASRAATSITSATGTNLLAQWNRMTNQSQSSGSWSFGTDMAIDANGNFYLFVTHASTRHALVRLNVPQDSNGEPLSTGWTYEMVKAFTADTSSGSVYGVAFMDGQLYTQNSSGHYFRYDTLSGAATDLGTDNSASGDLAAAQMAPVISGTVSNDVDGDGVIEPGEPGVANVTVEIWQGNANQGSTSWTKRGELITNSSGNYSALLNSAVGEYLVRVKRPVINSVNAVQTYAGGGTFYESGSSGPANTLTPLCVSNGVDYTPNPSGGACDGARLDGIDAFTTTTTGNPLAATGGALIVSKVEMTTDLAVVDADFGITAAASWGDAPILSTNAQSGPYANPNRAGQPYLYLGATSGTYEDGTNHAEADAHPTDDGLEISPTDASGQSTGAWAPAQSQLMVSGKTYAFRAKASGDSAAVAASTIKAWITGITGSTAATTFNTNLLGGGGSCTATPDVNGYVYCTYTAPAVTIPATGVVPTYARARVSNDSGVTATSRAPSNPATSPWQLNGEVEDYQLGVAGAVLRIQARTLGSVAANVNLTLGNVSNTRPSYNTDSILTNAANTFQPSTRGHAIISRTSGVSLQTTGVGAAGATTVEGWRLSAEAADTRCFVTSDPATAVAATVNATDRLVSIAAPASGGQLPEDITCQLTYIPQGSATASTVTVNPTSTSGSRLEVAKDSTEVTITAVSRVRDLNGTEVTVPATGETVNLSLTPVSPAPATGAFFEYSTNDGDTWLTTTSGQQSFQCVIGVDGHCTVQLRVSGAKPGQYNLRGTITVGTSSQYIQNGHTEPLESTQDVPVPIWFKEGPPAAEESEFKITSLGQKFARGAKTGAEADYHTGVIVLNDAQGTPITGAAANLGWDQTAPPASLVEITEDTQNPGYYNVRIYSSAATTYTGLKVRYLPTGLVLTAAEVAAFRTPDAVVDDSSMTVTNTPNQLANHNAPGSSAASWGKQTITVTLQDSGENPYPDAVGRLAAVSPANGTLGVYYANPTGVPGAEGGFACAAALVNGKCVNGVYTLDVYASLAGAHQIKVYYLAEGNDMDKSFYVKAAGAEPRDEYVTAVFATPPTSAASSVFVVGVGVDAGGNDVTYSETEPQDNWNDPADTPNGVPVTHDPGASYHPGVRVWDAGRNNPIESASVRLALADSAQAGDPACSATFGSGSKTISGTTSPTGKFAPAAAAVTSTIAGVCVITAEVQNEQGQWVVVGGSPKTLTWQNLDVESADFTVSTGDVVADGVATGTITVHLLDENNYPVTDGAGSISAGGVLPSSGIAVGQFALTNAATGEYTATFTGTKSNPNPSDTTWPGWEIKVSVGGALDAALASGGNKYAHMVAGPVDVSASWLIEPAGSTVADGQHPQTVRVRALDKDGNRVANGTAVTFTIPLGTSVKVGDTTYVGVAAGTPVPVTTSGGEASIAVVSNDATWDNDPVWHAITATVTVDGEVKSITVVKNEAEAVIPGRDDNAVHLVFDPDEIDLSESWLVQPSPSSARVDEGPLTVKVHAKDAKGNDLSSGSVTFAVPAGLTARSVLAAGGLSNPVAGGTAGATITAAIVRGYATVQYSTAAAGDYVITATAQVEGQAQAITAVKNFDETGADGPQDGKVELYFRPLPVTEGDSWLIQPNTNVTPPKIANGQDYWLVQVHARDEHGNNAEDGTEIIFTLPGGTSIYSNAQAGCPAVTQSDAISNGWVTSTRGGYAAVCVTTLDATYDNIPSYFGVGAYIKGIESAPNVQIMTVRNDVEAETPVRETGYVHLVYEPGPVVLGNSWLVQPTDAAKANGSDTIAVRAHLKDANGNDVRAGQVRFYIPAGTSVGTTSGPTHVVADVANGYAEILVKSTVATDGKDGRPDHHAVTAGLWNGQTATAITTVLAMDELTRVWHEVGTDDDDEVWLEFTPDDPVPAESWLVQPTATALANGAAPVDVVAHVRDINGNNAADGSIVVFTLPEYTLATVDGVERTGPTTVEVETVGGLATLPVRSARATDEPNNAPDHHKVTAKIKAVSPDTVDSPITTVRATDSASGTVLRTTGEVWLEYTPLPPAPGSSWLIQPEPDDTPEANGQESLIVAAHVKDGNGNNAADGAEVTFSIPVGTTAKYLDDTYTGPITVPTTTSNGYAEIEVTSTVATDGQQGRPLYHSVTATTTGGARIMAVYGEDEETQLTRPAGDVQLIFGAGDPDSSASWLIQPPMPAPLLVANGAGPGYEVAAHVRDKDGNDARTGTVVFTIPAKTAAGPVAGPNTVEVPVEAGWAKITVTSTDATDNNSPAYHAVTAALKGAGAITTVKNNDADPSGIVGQTDVRLQFRPGDVDPATTAASLWVDDQNALADGVAVVAARMTIQDAQGNPVSGATGCSFELIYPATEDGPLFGNAATGSKTTTVTEPTGADGRCEVQIRSYHEGSTPVKGIYNDGVNPAAESPGPDADRPKANFDNGAPSAPRSEFSVAPTATNASPDRVVANLSDSYTVTVIVRDVDGGVLNNYPVSICYYLLPGGTCVSPLPEVRSGAGDNPPGTATFELKTDTIGTYRIGARVGGDPVATEPNGSIYHLDKEFVHDRVDKTRSTVAYSEGTALPNDQGQHQAEVTLLDALGNPVSGTDVTFSLTTPTGAHFVDASGNPLNPDPGASVTLTSSDRGRATVFLRKAGPANEDVTLGISYKDLLSGTPVPETLDSHIFVFEAGGPDPAKSTFKITNPKATTPVANDVDYYDAVVTVRDGDDIPLPGKPVTFSFNLAGVKISPVASSYTTDGNGEVKVTFSTDKAGTYTVNAGVGGGHALPVDQEIEFVHGPSVPGSSTLVTSNNPVLAKPSLAKHTATVTVRDGKNNPVEGQDVFFVVSQGSADVGGPYLSAATAKSDEFGVAEVDITSDEPGTFEVWAYLGTSAVAAQEVGGSPGQVLFTAGLVSAEKSLRGVDPNTDADSTVSVTATGQGDDKYRITATIYSNADILHDGANVRLVLDSGSPVVITPMNSADPQVTGVATSDHYGTYYWDARSTTSGAHYAYVQVRAADGWAQVGARVALNFSADEPSGAHSWLVEPGGSVVADGQTPQYVSVWAFDVEDNPASSG